MTTTLASSLPAIHLVTGIVVVGDVINDVVVRPDRATAVDSGIPADITPLPGGSGANQAAWLAALGVPVRLAARVGAADAAYHGRALSDAGVDPHLMVDPDLPTGFTVVLLGPDGTRSRYTDRGANARLQHLGPELLEGAGHLHVSGYALIEPVSRAAVDVLWHAAGESGLTRSVDAAVAASVIDVGPTFADCTEGADILFATLAEGRAIAGRAGVADGAAEAHHLAACLLERYPIVVLKLGPEGAIVTTRAVTLACPPSGGPAVDPTGAGDAFCAGFLSRWLAGAQLAEAAAAASAAWASAMAVVGGRPPPAASVPGAVGGRPGPASPAPPEGALWERLRNAARQVSANAHAPYSGLGVGAAGLTDDGRVVAGCNVENASFGLALCAECGLVSALRAAGANRLVAVSVVAHDGEPLAPCGRCRQVLWENGGPEMLIDRGPAAPAASLGDLLPGSFNSDDLLRRRSP